MLLRIFVGTALLFGSVAIAGPVAEGPDNLHLRSAFLGKSRWRDQSLSPADIKAQLQQHFAVVIQRLEKNTSTNLGLAVRRAEHRSGRSWSDEERQLVRRQLAANRRSQIHTLRNYARRGRFPLNEGQSPSAIPIFVDDHGTHCAVGYLMHRSGADDAVAEVVRANNFVVVPDVLDGPLVDWIISSGITQEEAALIQPAYAPPEFDATLADFAIPGLAISDHGMTITNFSLQQYSFSTLDSNTAFDDGLFGLSFGLGTPYPFPNQVGVAIGNGTHLGDPLYGCPCWDPEYGDWVFVGTSDFSGLGQPGPNDNAIIFEFAYDISIDDGVTNNFALTSNANFNFNFVDDFGDDYLRIASTVAGADAASVELDTDNFFLNGVATAPLSGSQYRVTTRALLYDGQDPGTARITSFFNEFDVVPEPRSMLWAIVSGLGLLRPRVRNMATLGNA